MATLADFPAIARLDDGSLRPYPGPTYFLHGAKSDYVRPQHRQLIQQLFPQATYRSLPTGHWVHAEIPRAL